MFVFKGAKGSSKALKKFIKKSPIKDVTAWCKENIPCNKEDLPVVTVTEFNNGRPTTREAKMNGIMPYSLAGKDLCGCVMEYLDMRRYVMKEGSLYQRDVSFEKANMTTTSFRGSAMSRVSFESSDLRLAVLNSCILTKCVFANANLSGATLVAANLGSANLSHIVAPSSDWSHAIMENAVADNGWFCSEANYKSEIGRSAFPEDKISLGLWSGATFFKANTQRCDFRNAKLCAVDFSGANLTGALLQGADMRFCNLSNAKLMGANLVGADLRGARGIDTADLTWVVLLGGVRADDGVFTKHKDTRNILVDKAAVEANATKISDANFDGIDLQDVNMAKGQLSGCSFRSALLRGANFSGANLTSANFRKAVMYSVNLCGAVLCNAVFDDADMRSVNLSGVNLTEAADNLIKAKNLVGAICTIGTVPQTLKERGVIDRRPTMDGRVNADTVLMQHEAVHQEAAQRNTEERAAQQARMRQSVIDRIEDSIMSLAVPCCRPDEIAAMRVRLLHTVLAERHSVQFPSGNSEKTARWLGFVGKIAAFGITATCATVKAVYCQLIGPELTEDMIVALWRRASKDVKKTRMGSLQSMCLEKMLQVKDWSAWSVDMADAVKLRADNLSYFPDKADAHRRRTEPLMALFRSNSHVATAQSSSISGGEQSPSSSQILMAAIQQQGSPSGRLGVVVSSPTGSFSLSASGQGSPKAVVVGGSYSPSAVAVMPPRLICDDIGPPFDPPRMPSAPMLQAHVQTPGFVDVSNSNSGGGCTLDSSSVDHSSSSSSSHHHHQQQQQQWSTQPMSMSAQMSSILNVPPPPGTPPPPSVQTSSLAGMMTPIPMQLLDLGGTPISPFFIQQQQQEQQQQQQTMMTIPGNISPYVMQPVKIAIDGSVIIMQQQAQMQAQPRSPSQRIKCLDCGATVDAIIMQHHKKDCSMRLTTCQQCKYTMRFVQWDTHVQYCGTVGTCPLCVKSVKDNMIVHMYEKHQKELSAKGFFKGAAPPYKSTAALTFAQPQLMQQS